MNVSLQESKSSSLARQLSYNGKPHIGDISVTLRRQSPWTTSWKPLGTGLQSPWLKQKLCREQARAESWSPAVMAQCWPALAAVEPGDARDSFQPCCHQRGASAGLWSQTPLTDCWWLKPAAVWLSESQIIKLPVNRPYLTFYMSC